ncbi:ATP-binding protein [Paenibacillus sp. GCM10027628]|uniref:HAMP domain-containing sensor histidine kinase n=1 Tax=Paenibacillus sp. GCM10027628 TaxID=3273413 RepID=UPI00363DBF77
MKMWSIKRQFIGYFSLVLGISLVVTLLVWLAVFWLISNQPAWLRPANYYEKQIPAIEAYTEKQGDQLLQPSARMEFERLIPQEGMTYAVLDSHGAKLYGSLDENEAINGKPLVRLLNTGGMTDRSNAYKIWPLINPVGEWKGTLILKYSLTVSAASERMTTVIHAASVVLLLLPFLLVILFTWLLGKRFGMKLSKPIAELIAGTKRVRQRDLDFSFSYTGTRELMQLTQAFEEMRMELQQSLQREWQLEQERRDMVSALAHDLRTPITIIQGHLEGLLEGGAERPERLYGYLATIDRNIKRVAKLVGEINVVSEMEKPDFTLEKRPVDIESFVREKAAEFKKLILQRTFYFKYEDLRKESLPVGFDPYRVSQIMENLVANSIRFTPEQGGVRFVVSVKEREWYFEISDSGPGFPEGGLTVVFEKFYQGDPSRSQHKGHTGLGLYIAKLLTVKHGGTISASNTNEGGACVRVTLPVV